MKWGPWPAHYARDANTWRRHGTQHVNNVTLIQGSAACVPCLKEGCDRQLDSFSDCLRELPASRVIAAAEELLRQTGSSKPLRPVLIDHFATELAVPHAAPRHNK